MKRVAPDGEHRPALRRTSPASAARSTDTLEVSGSSCLRCPDEPCIRFGTLESGGGNAIAVCPVDAITMSHEYELSVMDRDGLIYTKTELGSIGGQRPNWWESGSGEFTGTADAWAGTRDGKNLLGPGVYGSGVSKS